MGFAAPARDLISEKSYAHFFESILAPSQKLSVKGIKLIKATKEIKH